MRSIVYQREISKTGVLVRLFSGIWLFAVLLILHGIVQAGHLTNSPAFVPNVGSMVDMSSSERADSPSLQPRAAFGSILTEARSFPPGRALAPDTELPPAILPASVQLSVLTPVEQPRPASGDLSRPKANHAFEARAPPNMA